ncbi:sterol desaturase family protein [Granulicella mallensis]|uniref:Fatty acid hydroxylase n=1 Tax=Granulicella mallensis (strain ATCC BAA-1857 / DSM 23137 / MP5ACTX8) TaxID=682795 RepID=G8NUB2_GRAMM|nr:sterol desaturase family protein [Granulicella mallensis]AEU35268.1 fatty acid hydroxylase [Granulicella mallensis MP5ACTX8]
MSWIAHATPTGTVTIDWIVTSIQSFLSSLGVSQHGHTVALWLFFAGCGVLQLCLSFLVCTPIERYWPLTSWSPRNPIAADVAYAFFVRLVLFPLVAFFEYSWLQQQLDRFFLAHSISPPSLTVLVPALASWPLLVFFLYFAILDLSDYWRHRLSHRYGWWYGVHSVHHAEDQMTFWSDERSHVLEDTITYLWLIVVGLLIGVPAFQFPFVILGFRLVGSMAHSNTRISYGWLGDHIFISPRFHRTHHALKAAGRRSCNFGTALSWWDILFRTAKFHDSTVETGDAGAEPAMVTGSWGEQQAAGFRRMVRLARRARKADAAKVTS